MTRLIYSLFLLVFLFLFSCNKEELKKVPPKAVKGVLDLRQWVGDPLSNSFDPINLDGEWEFYWNELLDSGLQPTAQQVGDPLSTPNYIPVPSQWQKHGYTLYGFATYRLRILLPQDSGLQPTVQPSLSIAMTDAATAYEMYINGKLASLNGKVGKTKEESDPFFRHQHFSIDKFLDKNEIEILIHVSNFHHFKAGLWDKIKIGSTQSIEREAKQKFGLDISVFSCLLIMALYHFGLYLNRKKDLSALYFTLLCSFFALRIPTINEKLILDVFPDLPFFILFKLEYLSLYLGSYMFASFVRYLFQEEFSKRIYLVISVVSLSCSAIVLLFPMNIFTRTLIIVQITILVFTVYIYKVSISAILHKRLGAKLFLVGFIFFMFAFVNDILRTMGYLGTPLLASYGLLAMVVSQAIILSRRFAGGFERAEKLSNELQVLTQSLESKISEGVKEKEKYSQCLLELSKSKTKELFGFESALREFTETCAKILNVDRVSIWKLDLVKDELKSIDLFITKENKHENGMRFNSSKFPKYFQYVKEEDILSAANVYSHPGIMEFNEDYHIPLKIQSALDSPIRSGGNVIGVISCEKLEIKKEWTIDEENFVSSLTNILASLFESEERQKAYADLIETKKEIEDLNIFSHLINSLPDLNSIFIEISKYFYHKFGITAVWLLLPDEKREFLFAYKAYSYNKLPEDKYHYLMTKKVPLRENEGGIVYKTFQRKKPFYLGKIPKFEFEIDREIVEKLSLASFFQVPLVRKEECVGIFSFTNFENEMKISKSDIHKITNLCSQIAGAIDTNNLLQQVDKSRKETEALNEISKSVNSNLNIKGILDLAMGFVNNNFGIDLCALYLVDKQKNIIRITYLSNIIKDYLTLSDLEISKSEFSLEKIDHALGYVYQTKETLYTKELIEPIHETEKKLIDFIKLKSSLLVPLLLKNEVIGILGFSNYDRIMDLKEIEITTLEKIADQLTGAIYNSNLLEETQKARAQADLARIDAEIERGISVIAKLEVEKAKKKTEELNHLIKKVNETSDLEEIMKIILSYVRDNYHLPYYSLFTLDPKENVLKYANSIVPDYVTFEHKKAISSSFLSVTEKNMDSIHSRALSLKTPIFLPDAEAEIKTKIGRTIHGILKHKSNLTLPIILQNNPIGTLDFFSLEPIQLREEEITELSLLAEQLAGVIQGAILLKQVQEEKEKAELAKQEIETLNEFTKLINSTSDISLIFKEIYAYLNRTFGFTNLWVLLVDKNTKELYSDMNTTLYKEGIVFDFDFFNNFRVKLDEKLGTLYQTYTNAVPFYVTDVSDGDIKTKTFINEFNGEIYTSSKTDLKINIKGKLKSLLQIPLILQNEVIGIVCLSIFDKLLELSHDQIEKLVSFSNQIAGVIHNAQLLKQTEEAKGLANIEKEKAIVAREEAEKQKIETEELNKLIKSLNEDMDIKVIMKKVHEYMKTNYNINYYGLGVVDNNKELAVTIDTCSPEFISTADQERISRFSTRVKSIVGAHAFAFKTKKLFYAPRIRKSGMNEEELFNQETTKLESILIIPLILQNEPIGFLDLYNVGKMELSKEDITKLSILGEQLAGIIYGSNLFKQVQEEKEKAQTAQLETEKAKAQVEFLNEFSKVINSYNNLDIIFSHAVENLSKKIDTDIFQLQLVDKTKNELFTRCLSGTDSGLMKKYNQLRVPLIPKSGSLYLTYLSKETLYLKNVKRIAENKKSELDNMVEKDFQIDSVFLIPLLVNNEVIGIMSINKFGGMKKLKADEVRFVESLCEQLALAVNNSFLLEETENARKETEGLNKLMRNVNSVSSLVDIMSFVMYYLETKYHFNDFYLLLNEEAEEKLVPFSFTSTRHTEEEKSYFLEAKIEHRGLQGIVAEVLETKRPIFMLKENVAVDDLLVQKWIEKGRFDYLFLLPLVIYDKLIGILCVHSPKTVMTPSEEVRLKMERFSDLIAGSIFNARLLKKVELAKEEADYERAKSEKLLLNILPKDVASELKEKGFAEPVLFENVSVMFTDFKGFTTIAERLSPQELIKDLDACFVQFDKITERVGLEKLKTIGDSYMCAGGIPRRNTTHAIDCCLAALEIQSFMNMMKKLKEDMGFPYWELRLGIHTGPLIAGVIGERKFAYDVWGDTVNTASRMESSGTPGKINISYSTYELVKDYFECEYRGEVSAKNKGMVKMYYLHSIKPEFSKDESGRIPNEKFWAKFSSL